MSWFSVIVQGGENEGAREDRRSCRAAAAHSSRFASRSSSKTTLEEGTSTTGGYDFASSIELGIYDPEQTIERNVYLANRVASDETISSICSRSRISSTVALSCSIKPVLLCLPTSRSQIKI